MIKIDEDRIHQWKKAYEKKKTQINKIKEFTIKNFNIYREFNKLTIGNLIKPYDDIQEVIYFAFIDCINASGGNHLTNTAKSCRKVIGFLGEMKDVNQISFKEFMKYFGFACDHESGKVINGFFDYLVGKNTIGEVNFPNFKQKKASLFLRDLYYIDKQRHIFTDYDKYYNKFEYKIALDIVIEDLFNIMLGYSEKYKRNENKDSKIKWKKHKELINSETGQDFYNFHKFLNDIEFKNELAESLWFWGYFNTTSKSNTENGKKNIIPNFRIVKFNEDKYNTNKFFYPSEGHKFEIKLKAFSNLFNKEFYKSK